MNRQDATLPTFKKKFRQRVFFIMLVTVFFSSILTGGLGFFLNIRTLKSTRQNRGRELLLYLAESADMAIAAKDNTFLEPIFDRLKVSPEFRGAAVYDIDGKILFSQLNKESIDTPMPASIRPKKEHEGKIRIYSSKGDFLQLIAPIYTVKYDNEKTTFGTTGSIVKGSELSGYALIRISTKLTKAEKKQTAIYGIIIATTVFLLGILFSIGSATKISNPIRRIIKGVNRLREGDLSATIKVTTDDEMGQIADSFNRLARNLKQRMDELENWSKTLENEVKKQTVEIQHSRTFLHELIETISGKKTDWNTILDHLIKGTGAVEAHLFKFMPDGKFKLLTKLATDENKCHDIQPFEKITEKSIIIKNEQLIEILGDDLTKNNVLRCIPLKTRDKVDGQLILIYNENSFSERFLDQAVSALTITLNNIAAFEKLNKLAKKLEKRNTMLISQKQELERQKQELEELNRLKSEFLANVSHELRTPLNAIIGYSEMLSAGFYGELNEEQAENIGVIEESGRNLLNLINTILDHSRLESGKMPLHVEMIHDLREVIKHVIVRNQSLTKDKPFELSVDLPEYPVACLSDAGKIEQILTNLISNAVKFTDKGKVHTVLKTDKEYIKIQVEDTGSGIPENEIDHIFEEFRQIDGTSTREKGGTGLGLAVCKKLAALLGGEITVQSTPDEGSVFTVTILRHLEIPQNQHPLNS